VRFSAIGDIVLTLPVLDALAERFPEARIDYATKAEFADLVRRHPAVGRVWSLQKGAGFAGLRRMAREMDGQGYDLMVDLHRNLRSAYLRHAVGAALKRVYGKRVLARLLLKYARINLLRHAPPVADRYFTALADFSIGRDGRLPALHLDDQAARAGDDALAGQGIGAGEEFIALAPGASHPTKRWPPLKFAQAGAELAGAGMKAVVLGGGGDREAAGEVADELGRRGVAAVDLAGRLSLIESAAVLRRARVLVTNDSGLMHVAAALKVPVVAVFGPTSRELGFYPLGPRSRVVESLELACRPCTLHGDLVCPRGHFRCMEEIGAERVVEAAREVMAGP
jgi:heptosyltransferase-2